MTEAATIEQGITIEQLNTEFVDAHLHLTNFLMAKRITKTLADDVVQSTYVRAATYVHTFKSDGSARKVRSWLLTIAKNELYHTLRKNHTYQADPENIVLDRAADVPDEDTRLDAIADLELLDQLRPDHKQMLKMVMDFEYEEIALLLNKPVGTVKSGINRARLKLAKLIAARNGTNPYVDETVRKKPASNPRTNYSISPESEAARLVKIVTRRAERRAKFLADHGLVQS
jgi:RNA polymerase sigma-70 factor (ECF subfamily)